MSDPHLPLPAARRTALFLALASAIGGSSGPIAIGTGGLVGMSLLPAEQMGLATIPVSTYILGSALASVPAALLMRRIGRRLGFMVGAGLGAAGAAIIGAAILLHAFWLFAFGMTLLGSAGAFGQQYRFAAADAAEPAFKPKAISWVLAGGVVTGVLGPQVAIHAQPLIPGAPYAGPFFALIALFAIAALVLSRLVVPAPPPIVLGSNSGRPLSAIVLRPKFLIALLSAIGSYALMSLIMTATPLAMVEHHHSHDAAQTAIQWHVIAMFGPSFFTGSLIARFGKSTIAAAGLLLIAGAATVALTGDTFVHFSLALILLGMGWNFGFIASTAMVAELYRPDEAFRVQAANEFVLLSVVAVASFASGGILVASGWTLINLIVYPIVALCVLLILGQALIERRSPPQVATP
jgi:MFS family permease